MKWIRDSQVRLNERERPSYAKEIELSNSLQSMRTGGKSGMDILAGRIRLLSSQSLK